MIKIAEEQAVQAEVLGATASLMDRGIIHIASMDALDGFVKEASDYMLEQGYNTPEELVSGIIGVYDYLTKHATDLEYSEEDMEPEDYEEDEEDAEEDTVAEVIKQASDEEEAMNTFAELYDAGYISDYTLNKVASAYEYGYLDKIAAKGTSKRKTTKKAEKLGLLGKVKAFGKDNYKKLSKRIKNMSPVTKGIGAGALTAGAGIGGYAAYKRYKNK